MVFSLFEQLLDSVQLLHSSGYAHRDLKLSNILIPDGNRVKLIDFGFSTGTNSPSKLYCGTPSYMAPELVNRKVYMPKLIDVWALGVILYRLMTGNYPFGSKCHWKS